MTGPLRYADAGVGDGGDGGGGGGGASGTPTAIYGKKS